MSRLVKISAEPSQTTTLTARFQQIQNSAPQGGRQLVGSRREGNTMRTRTSRTTAISAKRSMATSSKPTTPIIRTAPSHPRSVFGTRPASRQVSRQNQLRPKVGINNKPRFAGAGNRPGVQKTNGAGNNNRRGGNNNNNNNNNNSRAKNGNGKRFNKNVKKGPLTKEGLDKDLDEYMSSSKAGLDRDLDQMMSERATTTSK